MINYVLWAAIAIIIVWSCNDARAAEVTLVAPGGIRAAVEQMIPAFEKKTGHKVKPTFGRATEPRRRSPRARRSTCRSSSRHYRCWRRATWLPRAKRRSHRRRRHRGPDRHTASRHLDAEAVKKLFSAQIDLLSRSGGRRGGGRQHQRDTAKLGIADEVKPKIKLAQGGAGAMKMLAKGQVDIGLTFISEIITETGVEVVARCRARFRLRRLCGFISAKVKDHEAAKALLSYLSGPEAAAVYKNAGMQPGR